LGHRPQEPLLVRAFTSELAVESLDVAGLHRPARLGPDVPYAMCYGLSQESTTCVTCATVRSCCQGVASQGSRWIQHACDVLRLDPEVNVHVREFLAEAIGYRQALAATTVGHGGLLLDRGVFTNAIL
jgi:hypothetical protein